MGNEPAGLIVAMVRRECGRMANEERGSWTVMGAVSAGGALHPNKIAASIGDEKEALRWGPDSEIDEVLARAGGGAGDKGRLNAVATTVEGGEENGKTVGVGGEKLSRRGERVLVEKRKLEVIL